MKIFQSACSAIARLPAGSRASNIHLIIRYIRTPCPVFFRFGLEGCDRAARPSRELFLGPPLVRVSAPPPRYLSPLIAPAGGCRCSPFFCFGDCLCSRTSFATMGRCKEGSGFLQRRHARGRKKPSSCPLVHVLRSDAVLAVGVCNTFMSAGLPRLCFGRVCVPC